MTLAIFRRHDLINHVVSDHVAWRISKDDFGGSIILENLAIDIHDHDRIQRCVQNCGKPCVDHLRFSAATFTYLVEPK